MNIPSLVHIYIFQDRDRLNMVFVELDYVSRVLGCLHEEKGGICLI